MNVMLKNETFYTKPTYVFEWTK